MKVHNLGLIPYSEAHRLQLKLVDKVINNPADESLIICHHPPVVTLGKKSGPDDLQGWRGDVHSIERGGKATYHGPGQVVVYPIINLSCRNNDIAAFLETLEMSMIETLAEFGLLATGNPNRGVPTYTGVWVNNQKVASIGVAVRRWVTYHGLALNLYDDPEAFKGINPCGFGQDIMTNVERLLGHKLERTEFEERLSSHLIKSLRVLETSTHLSP